MKKNSRPLFFYLCNATIVLRANWRVIKKTLLPQRLRDIGQRGRFLWQIERIVFAVLYLLH